LVNIGDNGIGRTVSALQRERFRALGRRSRGLDLLRERLRLLEAIRRRPHHLEIKDLYDPDGHPTGTQVTLWLPL